MKGSGWPSNRRDHSFQTLSSIQPAAGCRELIRYWSRPVIYVIPGTPAAKSELRSGDRLCRINDTNIGDNLWSRNTAHNVLKEALRKGEDITLRVMRRGSHDQIVSVLTPEPMCQSFVYLIQDSIPNAFADGRTFL